jgi:CheY-like chemotaxis protein
MSYILKIREPPAGQPVPPDVASVSAAVEALEEGAPRPSSRFAPLLEHLTRRYPDITSAAAQHVAESAWAWSDGPLAASTRDTVMLLGLRSETVDSVQPFVVEQATAQRKHPVLQEVPVIMLTGKATREAVLKGIAAGADGYITKPFEPHSLLRAVRAVLGLPEES